VTEVTHGTFSNSKGLEDSGTLGLFTWGPKGFPFPKRVQTGCRALSPRLRWLALENCHSSLFSANVKNAWSYASILFWFNGMHKNNCIFVPHLLFHIGDFLENKAYTGFLPFLFCVYTECPISCFYKKHNHLRVV